MEVPDNNKKFKALNHFSHPLALGGQAGTLSFPRGHWEEGGNDQPAANSWQGPRPGPRQEAGRVGVEKGLDGQGVLNSWRTKKKRLGASGAQRQELSILPPALYFTA